MARTGWRQQAARLVSTPAGAWFFVHVATHVDRVLLPLTGGRVSIAVGEPVLLLESTGAKSGETRRRPLVYATDGDDIVLVASNGGSARHPAWYHNLKAHPEVKVVAPRRSGRYVAHEAEGEERARLWQRAVDVYAGYDAYQERAGGRRIPVMVLQPAR